MAHKTSINILLTIGCLAGISYAVIVSREYLAENGENNDLPPPPERKFVQRLDAQYSVFMKNNCSFVDIESWTPDAIKIHHNGSIYQFRLYFAQTPPTKHTESTTETIREQMAYFGDPPMDQFLAYGEEANTFVKNTLTERNFRIVTRYEPVRGSQSIYAFIQVEGDDGQPEYLSALLVRNGLASITAKASHTPFGQNMLDFREILVGEREKAIANRSGIWKVSRLAAKLDEARRASQTKPSPAPETPSTDE